MCFSCWSSPWSCLWREGIMKRAVKKWIWKGPKLESSLWERVVPGRSEEGTTFGSLGILGGFWFLWWIDEGGFWILGSWNEMTFRERSYIVRRGYRISHLSSRTQISLCAIITEPKTSLPSAPLSVHHSPLCSSGTSRARNSSSSSP